VAEVPGGDVEVPEEEATAAEEAAVAEEAEQAKETTTGGDRSPLPPAAS
jgi:hypothetical protein